jgi:hypothetical protein
MRPIGRVIRSEVMKMSVVAAMALAAALALPAGANAASSNAKHVTKHASKHVHVIVRPRARGYARVASPYSAYGRNPANDVYVHGDYIGSDPDPRIRNTIRREYLIEENNLFGR